MLDSLFGIEAITLQLLIIPFLYAETHYRFKYFFSYLKKKEPEIIADMPFRLQAGKLLPILIVIKDADKYPVVIHELIVYEKDQMIFQHEINQRINQSYKDLIFRFNSDRLTYGEHFFDIMIRYRIGSKEKICLADNHRGTSHSALPIYISADPLPRFDHCAYGESHCHTNYTSDQVEFGASLTATKEIARALDLDFFCATDHSYDLDDYEDDYLRNDPDLTKWHAFQKEVEELNSAGDRFLIIPGEEVSVRNSKNQNVHMLVFNSDKFFPGTGDSGEKWLDNYSELSIADLISSLDKSSLVFAAHPAEAPPVLQKLFIRRGIWNLQDFNISGLHGMQFINGGEAHFQASAKKQWIELLLSGHRFTGIAGNDAHGNFSRFRQIGFPFFTMRENYYHLFGKWRSGVYIKQEQHDFRSILKALRSGNCFVSNGPALQMKAYDQHQWKPMGSECVAPELLEIEALSSEEFAGIEKIKIFLGDIISGKESVLFEDLTQSMPYSYANEIKLENLPAKGYLRLEVSTIRDYQALSNPIWF